MAARRNQFNGTRNKLGFTLIEILIVVAIIALLIAILVPTISTSREKARQTACLGNLKQVSMAITMYAQDNDSTFPALESTSVNSIWATELLPYVKSMGLYLCPSDVTKSDKISYAANSAIASHSPSCLAAPAKTVFFMEVSGDGSSTGSIVQTREAAIVGNGRLETGAFPARESIAAFYATTPTAANGRHTSGSNYGFADGHVKWLPSNQVSEGATQAQSFCNQDNNLPLAGCGSWMMGDNFPYSSSGNSCALVKYSYCAAGTNGKLPSGTPVSATFSLR